MAVDPRKFLLNTGYEMDKIIYFVEGSTTSSEGGKIIAHGLGFAPLLFGVCSPRSDFTDSRTIPYERITRDDSEVLTVSADSDYVIMDYYNYGDQAAPMYYRIYGLEPSTSTASIASTSDRAKQFILNTDYNYLKLFKKGIMGGDATVHHDLGYIPQALFWHEALGSISPINYSQPFDPMFSQPEYISVTNNIVKTVGLDLSDAGTYKVHYRIYYDEA